MQTMPVAQSVTGSIGELEFVYSADEDAFVLVGDSVGRCLPESTYQVWLVSNGDFTSLGTFEPDARWLDGDACRRNRSDRFHHRNHRGTSRREQQPTMPPVAASV